MRAAVMGSLSHSVIVASIVVSRFVFPDDFEGDWHGD